MSRNFFCFSKHNILFPFLITKLFDTMFSRCRAFLNERTRLERKFLGNLTERNLRANS